MPEISEGGERPSGHGSNHLPWNWEGTGVTQSKNKPDPESGDRSDVRTGGSDHGSDRRPRLGVIIASTRPGRAGLPVANWFRAKATEHGRFEVEMLDLAEVGLPLLDEPKHPRLGEYFHEHSKRWSASVDAADAFVLVMPEYNHGFNAALKNAIDYLYREWQHKPVAFVSYGGLAAGTRAVQMLKPVLAVLKLVPMPEAIAIPNVKRRLNEKGEFQSEEAIERAASRLLDELFRWTGALRPLRSGNA